jgi:phage major head subunit gpT-like protein
MKKDLYSYFWERYEDVGPKYQDIFDVVPSDSAYEMFNSAIGLGELLEKPEGTDMQADAPMENYTIVCKNRSFGRIVRFSYETIKDAKKTPNILMDAVGSWGRMVPITKEKFYAKFFNNGALTAGHDVFNNSISGVVTDASGNLIYDGKAFFSTTHASRAGTSYSNYSSTNALSHTNLQTVWNTFHQTNNRDERDEIVALTADTLLIPPALKFTAQVILETTLLPGSMDSDTNVLKAILNPVEWHYLTDTDGWFIGKMKGGLIATDREEPIIDFFMDEQSKDFFASIFTRFGGCINQWRFWYANNIASS